VFNATINITSFIVTVNFMNGGKKRTIKNTQTYHKFATTVSHNIVTSTPLPGGRSNFNDDWITYR